MKKCKLALVGLLLVLSMGVLVACGNEKNEETGSNTDSGNNHESTGVIEEIVTCRPADTVRGVLQTWKDTDHQRCRTRCGGFV